MQVSFSKSEFLQKKYQATEVFDLNSAETESLLKTFAQAINGAGYGKIATDYQVQFIGMNSHGRRKAYGHAWSNGNYFIHNPIDPKKDFISPKVADAGNQFVDGVMDLESGKIDIQAQNGPPTKPK